MHALHREFNTVVNLQLLELAIKATPP